MKIQFKYKNHRGEIADRTVADPVLTRTVYQQTGDTCWCIQGFCEDRKAHRVFRCDHILSFKSEEQ